MAQELYLSRNTKSVSESSLTGEAIASQVSDLQEGSMGHIIIMMKSPKESPGRRKESVQLALAKHAV